MESIELDFEGGNLQARQDWPQALRFIYDANLMRKTSQEIESPHNDAESGLRLIASVRGFRLLSLLMKFE